MTLSGDGTIVVAGGCGQLGRALGRFDERVIALSRKELEVRDPESIARALDAHAPSLVIDAAAYTAVDRAQTDRAAAFSVNADGAANLARSCEARKIPLMYVSTDYVFDGTSSRPYDEDDPVAPLSVYGESKAAGERVVRDFGGIVVRTSWLFSQVGPSFVQTVLRLATERRELRFVADRFGCPTWADDLAGALVALAPHAAPGTIYHYCGDGPTTWYELAVTIVELARKRRPLACEHVMPIAGEDHVAPAPRPARVVLDTARVRRLGIAPRSWRIGLEHVIEMECR